MWYDLGRLEIVSGVLLLVVDVVDLISYGCVWLVCIVDYVVFYGCLFFVDLLGFGVLIVIFVGVVAR